MKTFKIFIMVIVLTIGNWFFNGWLWSMAYKLGIIPFFSQFTNMPDIPYMMFVLLAATWSLIRMKSTGDKDGPQINTPEFVAKYIGIIVTDFMLLGALWVLNMIIM